MLTPILLADDGRSHGASFKELVDQLAAHGVAKIKLSADDAHAMTALHAQVERFFTADPTAKQVHACPNFHFGFRPYGRQYSIDPDRLDLNESFTYWSDDPELIPGHAEIEWFTSALHAYWEVATRVVGSVMHEIAARFSYNHQIDFAKASYIETNWYLTRQTRDLLQDRHEDGHLLTLVRPDVPGLEVEIDGTMQPVDCDDGELVIMSGSLMTDMTGGWIPPLYHQVRNRNLPKRSSLLYLVNPPFNELTKPFVVNDSNRGLDIGTLARTNGEAFGLPKAPTIPS